MTPMAEIADYQQAALERTIRDNEATARRILRAIVDMRLVLTPLAPYVPQYAEALRSCEAEEARLRQILEVSERCRAAAASGDVTEMIRQRDRLTSPTCPVGDCCLPP